MRACLASESEPGTLFPLPPPLQALSLLALAPPLSFWPLANTILLSAQICPFWTFRILLNSYNMRSWCHSLSAVFPRPSCHFQVETLSLRHMEPLCTDYRARPAGCVSRLHPSLDFQDLKQTAQLFCILTSPHV